eukprot:CAMPEP_0119506566 /NCGR_PEP_ID=MMETSP1344-20130328/26745_1 /TAXON_ID=236787 /ORGANISM="Florenciella parvula, Strain CCMP2471" /LENGTH=45 /DNA_ID= /DNA_START= /DNA_END= /DNA_ORIENTATION=
MVTDPRSPTHGLPTHSFLDEGGAALGHALVDGGAGVAAARLAEVA